MGMYKFYMAGKLLPITPGKLTLKIKGDNKTLTLINEGEINFLRSPGLTEISFDAVFPALTKYSYAAASYKKPQKYLEWLEALKVSKTAFSFIVKRGGKLFKTNMKVSLEDYQIKEDAGDGQDITVSINLKQYRYYGTKTVTLLPAAAETQTQEAQVTEPRETSNAPTATTYTVKKGDTLWAIAKYYYGAGEQYKKIYQANTSIISDPDKIQVGWVLTIP